MDMNLKNSSITIILVMLSILTVFLFAKLIPVILGVWLIYIIINFIVKKIKSIKNKNDDIEIIKEDKKTTNKSHKKDENIIDVDFKEV